MSKYQQPIRGTVSLSAYCTRRQCRCGIRQAPRAGCESPKAQKETGSKFQTYTLQAQRPHKNGTTVLSHQPPSQVYTAHALTTWHAARS